MFRQGPRKRSPYRVTISGFLCVTAPARALPCQKYSEPRVLAGTLEAKGGCSLSPSGSDIQSEPPRPESGYGVSTLAPMVYEELRQLAESYFRKQPSDHTLQPTALVNEAYLKLAEHAQGRWKDREHFLAVAARAMRQILVDHARGCRAAKRGAAFRRITLDQAVAESEDREVDLIALDEALTRLAELDDRKTRVVELRFFAGLTIEEAAEVLGVSLSTVNRDWRMARSWVLRELSRERAS